MKLVILRGGTAYAAVMAALHRQAFPKPWPPAEFASLSALPGVFGWIAVDAAPPADGAPLPVGFILSRLAADEAEILTLAVLPSFRRRGIAKALVRTAAHALREMDARQMFLEVAVGNPEALALYAGLGFREVGRRPNYYDPGVAATRDALTLRASLPLGAAH